MADLESLLTLNQCKGAREELVMASGLSIFKHKCYGLKEL